MESGANSAVIDGFPADLDTAPTIGPSVPGTGRIRGYDEHGDVRAGPVPGLRKADPAVARLDRVGHQQIDGRQLGNRRQAAYAVVGVDDTAVLTKIISEGVPEVPVLVNE